MDAFGVIRQVIEQMKMVAIGRIVLTSREHVIAMEPRGKGIVGTLLRYPYEVRDQADYFGDIPGVKLGKDAMDLAKHIVETKLTHFRPEKVRGSLRAGAARTDREERARARRSARRSGRLRPR